MFKNDVLVNVLNVLNVLVSSGDSNVLFVNWIDSWKYIFIGRKKVQKDKSMTGLTSQEFYYR